MHHIYRVVLNPKAGNIDEIHGFMIDIILTQQKHGTGLEIDVMDFIWNEIQWPFATGRGHHMPHTGCTSFVCGWTTLFRGDPLAFGDRVSHPTS
jgi:hypothetical protein